MHALVRDAAPATLLLLAAATAVLMLRTEPVAFSAPRALARTHGVDKSGTIDFEELSNFYAVKDDDAANIKDDVGESKMAQSLKGDQKDGSPELTQSTKMAIARHAALKQLISKSEWKRSKQNTNQSICSFDHPCCFDLPIEKNRHQQAGIGNRLTVVLQTAAIARAAGYHIRYTGEDDVFQEKDLQMAACAKGPILSTNPQGPDPKSQFSTTPKGFEEGIAHAMDTNALHKQLNNRNSECFRVGNGLVRTPETTALPGYRKGMPQSEYVQLLSDHKLLSKHHIISITSKAIQGLLGLTQRQHDVDECHAHNVQPPAEIIDFFHFMKYRDKEDTQGFHTGFLPEWAGWAAAGMDLMRANYMLDRAAFLKESPWMAPNLQHFDPAKFNIAVHVRQGDQSQDHVATLRQLEMIMEAADADKLGAMAGRSQVLHIFSQGPVPWIKDWWDRHSKPHWFSSKLTTHDDEGMAQTLDAFLTADVLGVGASTFSAAAAMLARGAVVYMKDGWPEGQYGRSGPQVPHDWYKDWMQCVNEIQTSNGILCQSKRHTPEAFADVVE